MGVTAVIAVIARLIVNVAMIANATDNLKPPTAFMPSGV